MKNDFSKSMYVIEDNRIEQLMDVLEKTYVQIEAETYKIEVQKYRIENFKLKVAQLKSEIDLIRKN